jgi:hypothetical protein
LACGELGERLVGEGLGCEGSGEGELDGDCVGSGEGGIGREHLTFAMSRNTRDHIALES